MLPEKSDHFQNAPSWLSNFYPSQVYLITWMTNLIAIHGGINYLHEMSWRLYFTLRLCVCLSVCQQDNSRTAGWIGFILGVLVGCDESCVIRFWAP